MLERRYSLLDHLIIRLDQQLARSRTAVREGVRPSPADGIPEATLNTAEKRHVEGLMRVNHAGEVSAQALYQGQALTSRDPAVRLAMHK